MIFATGSIMNASNIESVLNQVTRAIVTKGVENNIPESHANIRQKKQSGHLNAGEKHFLNMLPQDTETDSLPTCTNYWLAQRDPDYVHQAEKYAAIPKGRKRIAGPEQSVHVYLDNFREGVDPRRALREHFPNNLVERTIEGGHPSVRVLEYHFSNLAIGLPDAGFVTTAASRRMNRTKKAHWPRETI